MPQNSGKVKVGINGLGRIGRTILREYLKRQVNDFQIVAVNNPGDPQGYIHLLKYDSVHGKLPYPVEFSNGRLNINNHEILFHNHKDPKEIPWEQTGVDIVIDSTGVFKDQKGLGQHLHGPVKKVILCAPGPDDMPTFVMGINHENYNPATDHIVSNASCTTNCLTPLIKVLHEKFGVERGLMVTIHSYTSDQSLLDAFHSDPRRARSAAMSMIPTSTGAAKAVGLVIPSLKGKLDGYSVRVPTPDVSLVDFSAELSREVTVAEVNQALKEASQGALKGILKYTDEELVSVDYMGMPESSCVDGKLTKAIKNSVKVVSWYDNEVGFSNRVIDLATYIGKKL